MSRFIEKPDCYIDTETGLEWQKEQNKNKLIWEEAIKYCKSLVNVWRLPTRKELFSLVDDDRKDPCTDLPDILSAYYWSYSTTDVDNTDYAWLINFNKGNVNYSDKYNAYYVRAVRSGKGE